MANPYRISQFQHTDPHDRNNRRGVRQHHIQGVELMIMITFISISRKIAIGSPRAPSPSLWWKWEDRLRKRICLICLFEWGRCALSISSGTTQQQDWFLEVLMLAVLKRVKKGTVFVIVDRWCIHQLVF